MASNLDKRLTGLGSNVDIIKHIVYFLGPITAQDIAAKMAEVMLSFQPSKANIDQFILPLLRKYDYYTNEGGKWSVVLEKVPEHVMVVKVMREARRFLTEREIRSRLAAAIGVKGKSVCIDLEREPSLKKVSGRWGLKNWELVNDLAYELMKSQDKPLTSEEIVALVARASGKPAEDIVFDPKGDRRFVQERKAWLLSEHAEKKKSEREAASAVRVRQEPVKLSLEDSFVETQTGSRRGVKEPRDRGKVKLRKMMQQEAKQKLKEREVLVAPVETDLAERLSQEQEGKPPFDTTSFNLVEPAMKERSLSPKEREAINAFVSQLVEMADVGVGVNVGTVLREPLSLHKITGLLKLKYLPYFTERMLIPDDYYRFASELVVPHPGMSVVNPSAQAGAFATQMLNMVFERLDGAAWAPLGTHIEVAQRDGVRYKIHVEGTPLHRKSQDDFLIDQNDLIDYFILNNFAAIEGDRLLAQATYYNLRLSGFPNVYVAAKDFLSQLPEVFPDRLSKSGEVALRFDLVFGNFAFIKSHNLSANYLDQALRLLERDGVACVFVLQDLLRLLKDHDFMNDVLAAHDIRYVFHFPQVDTRNEVTLVILRRRGYGAQAGEAPLIHASVKDVKSLNNILLDLAKGVRQSAFYEVLKQESARRVLTG